MTPLDDREPEPVRVAVLLAGGEARRLGADKPSLRIGGATLLQRNLALLGGLFPRVAVSLREGQDLGGATGPGPAPEVLSDIWSGSPLGAIATALDHFGEPVFVLACDLALADRDAIAEVLDGFHGVDLALPIVGDKLEPLHAVYGPACLAPMRRLLERDRHRILDIAPDIRVAAIPFPSARPFFNINHPEDYELALRAEVERLIVDGPGVELRDGTSAAAPGAARQATRTPGAQGDAATSAAPAGAASPPAAQPPLVAIVGKSDSGKTTFIEKLLPELTALGLRVGTVKHDVHGFEIDTPGKDSWRHARAGASATMVAGPDRVAFIERSAEPQPLVALARRFFDRVDLVVAEGFKRQAPHRIEVFRRDAGHSEPLCGPGESLALVTDAEIAHPRRFALDDAAAVARLIAARLDELRRY
jgi:molybdopterin-guanine dinucleotide biosynthesis protein B